MTECLTHRTKAGDRWDLLAFDCYGSAFATEILLEANPECASMAILPSGLALKVPLVEQGEINPEKEGATPWR